jgi:hypothetical protein
MMPATVFDLMPAAPADESDFSPTRRWGAAGALGTYVACRLWEGRALFPILADEFVQERIDDEPDLLGRLAADTLVRDALERWGEPVAMPVAQLRAA